MNTQVNKDQVKDPVFYAEADGYHYYLDANDMLNLKAYQYNLHVIDVLDLIIKSREKSDKIKRDKYLAEEALRLREERMNKIMYIFTAAVILTFAFMPLMGWISILD